MVNEETYFPCSASPISNGPIVRHPSQSQPGTPQTRPRQLYLILMLLRSNRPPGPAAGINSLNEPDTLKPAQTKNTPSPPPPGLRAPAGHYRVTAARRQFHLAPQYPSANRQT